MGKRYGINYMGSKNSIAKDIISFLPSGNRLVDLFGGGFAISHCALELINNEQISLFGRKWNSVLYNEIDSVVVDFIKKTVNGKIDLEHPEWISRDDFFRLKDKDGLVKTLWSFGGRGDTYMYGKEIEPYKKACHYAIVFDEWNFFKELYPDMFDDVFDILKGIKGIKKRRLLFKKVLRNINVQNHQAFLRLEHIERLQLLERVERLQHLEITNLSYEQYQYQDGDVVYCDIPYENTRKYTTPFKHDVFFDWVKAQPFDIYISSYDNPRYEKEIGLEKVFETEKRSTLSATNNSLLQKECIYKHKAV